MSMIHSKTSGFILLAGVSAMILAVSAGKVTGQKWQPQRDEVYLQEVSEIIETPQPVVSVAVRQETCLVLSGGMVHRLIQGRLIHDRNAPAGIVRLKVENGDIWAMSGDAIYLHRNGSWTKTGSLAVVDLCTHNGVVHAATAEEIYRLEGDTFVSTRPEAGYHSSDVTINK